MAITECVVCGCDTKYVIYVDNDEGNGKHRTTFNCGIVYDHLRNKWVGKCLNTISAVKSLRARIAELEAQLAQRDTETYCAYCGIRYPLDDQAATLVSEHIRTCEKHPMREIERQLAAVTAQRDGLLEELGWLRDPYNVRGAIAKCKNEVTP